MMDMSDKGRKLLTEREGRKLKAYLDSGGVWTIGVGHTAAAGPPKPRRGMTVTEESCDRLLAHDLVQYEDAVERAVKVKMNQNEFDALVSLCFNIGISGFNRSSVVRYLNQNDRKTAADKFRLWNKDNGRVIRGLVNRRENERLQFLGKL